jgi:peptidoglycan/LPS O-acetylase OafA/YrhL
MAEAKTEDPVTASAPALVRGERYRLIDAFRGFACIMVLLFHSLAAYSHEQLTPSLQAVANVSESGWLRVYVFFAISGWCIAERWHVATLRSETPTRFLLDRLLRIFPVYWCAVLFTLGLRLLAWPFNTTSFAQNFPEGVLGWIGTLFLLDPYLSTPTYLVVSWTLVFEVGFYVCCAVGLAAFVWLRLRREILFAIGAVLCVLVALAGPRVPWLVLGLWPHFFAGIAGWCATHGSMRWAGVSTLLGLIALGHFAPHADAFTYDTAAIAALLLSLLHRFDARLSSLPGASWLMALGAISYSVYLVHVPILSSWQNLAARLIPPSSPLFLFVWASGIALAFGASWVFARAVEVPLLRWRRRVLA